MVHSPEIVPTAGSRVTVTISRNMTTRGMRRAILEGMEGAPKNLVIDLRSVVVMGDMGLALLMGINARQRARRAALTLVQFLLAVDISVREGLGDRTGLDPHRSDEGLPPSCPPLFFCHLPDGPRPG